jgi:hypothetical protein
MPPAWQFARLRRNEKQTSYQGLERPDDVGTSFA